MNSSIDETGFYCSVSPLLRVLLGLPHWGGSSILSLFFNF
jgi:hypothetical protein